MSIVELPIEVISLFFTYLNRLEDRKAASLVCQRWNKAYQSLKFRCLEKVIISDDAHFNELLQLPNEDFQIRNLQLLAIDLQTEDSYPFWSRYGQSIYHLDIINGDVEATIVAHILSKCLNLYSFALTNCILLGKDDTFSVLQSMPVNYLDNIVGLNLSNTLHMNDVMFCYLLNIIPNLKSLKLSGSIINFDNDDSHETEQKSITILTFKTIYEYLCNAKCIVELDFSSTSISTHHLKLICDIPTLKLNCINLSQCKRLSDEGILVLSKKQPLLMELELNDSFRWMTGEGFKYIGTLTKLKNLSFQFAKVTDNDILELHNLDLISLDISECKQITGRGLSEGMFRRPKPSLKILKMNFTVSINQHFLINIIRNVPNLRYLDLSCSEHGVTNNVLQNIIRSCRQLEVLIISKCSDITDSGLIGQWLRRAIVQQEFPPRHMLNINPPRNVVHVGVNLKKLKNLKELSLSQCLNITDKCFINGFQFSGLIKLDLSGCKKITDEGLKHISEKNPFIEELKLKPCNEVHDMGVWYVMKNLNRLKTFWLGSLMVSNMSLTYFEGYGDHLWDLDLSDCFNIDATLAIDLPYTLPNLKRFRYPDQPSSCPSESHSDESSIASSL